MGCCGSTNKTHTEKIGSLGKWDSKSSMDPNSPIKQSNAEFLKSGLNVVPKQNLKSNAGMTKQQILDARQKAKEQFGFNKPTGNSGFQINRSRLSSTTAKPSKVIEEPLPEKVKSQKSEVMEVSESSEESQMIREEKIQPDDLEESP